ncbi:NAD(P)H-binding protein [Agromyces seonyuensis]|uniref:NAD(P)H-binding protein n=1 Tax=Agromyces seonyuensis TaxID=2662446 RepID=A0A6I4P5Y8_9MICO|nr:NAD(P)H-binding protein [Agromyces seonyuensis]MWB98934.1 NAD(P)H-binding protein [Agromyces seonyuensis]
MTILVTAASGQLGGLVVDALLARGAEPASIVATARDESTLARFAERGVTTARLDYDDPASIAAALQGVDAVLLVSGSVPGRRVDGHRNVVEAAAAAGVGKLVYTSAPKATTADFALAPDHKATEELIAASGVPAVILRNNWYTENYAGDLAQAADSGVVAGSAGSGRVASATRAEYAEAAAVVLLEDGHVGEVYELSGEHAWDFDEFAAAAAEVLGRPVAYRALEPAEHVAVLEGAGLDAGTAGFVAAIDAGIRDGVLGDAEPTLARLIGRPTTGLVEALRPLAA